MTLPQSVTVQLPCSRHHFSRVHLDWTDRGTQTRGTRAYSSFICNLRCTVAADIASNGRCNHRCHTCGVCSAIPLGYNSNISIFRGSCNPWETAYGPSDNCLCGLELFS
ncbi:uncharacterized protein TNCV_47091 [Trichonephila clavipes]|nr:uncharacterized protein TNCV_47091 [Trichonephila clavipes]